MWNIITAVGLAIIGALQTFTTAFVATQGGPAYATWFYALHIYTTAFQFTEMGYAAALASREALPAERRDRFFARHRGTHRPAAFHRSAVTA